MSYGNETRLFLADFGLKLEGADMQLIIWMCGVFHKRQKGLVITLSTLVEQMYGDQN